MTLREICGNVKYILESDDLDAIYEAVKKLGYEGSMEEFTEEWKEFKTVTVLDQELDVNELKDAAGGKAPCGFAWCKSTYIKGENCTFNDDCNKFINGYTGL